MVENNPCNKRNIVIGLLSAPHMGDTLCTTPLPRMIKNQYGWDVDVFDHPSTRGIFKHNGYVHGFSNSRHVRLNRRMQGKGHVIQRLQRGFGLPVANDPKPEIYLSEEEYQWAREQRFRWPQDKPICLISTRAITDNGIFHSVNWFKIAQAWNQVCTLIQPILTQPKLYTKIIPSISNTITQRWQPETPLPNAIIYRDMPLRRYLALFSIVDYYCGPTSGGTHVAAAFEIPSLVIVWKQLFEQAKFPCTGPHLCPASFLYPQHELLSIENISHPQKLFNGINAVTSNSSPRMTLSST